MPSEDVLQCIWKNDAEIRISDYNLVPDKVKALAKRCKEMGIYYRLYEFAGGNTMWYDCGDKDTPKENDDKTVSARFRNCEFRKCLTLERGELSYCSRSTNSYAIQGFQRKPNDYLKVEDTKRFRHDLKKFMFVRHWIEACRYCNGTSDEHLISPAIQMDE